MKLNLRNWRQQTPFPNGKGETFLLVDEEIIKNSFWIKENMLLECWLWALCRSNIVAGILCVGLEDT